MGLQIGETAPDFEADSTEGRIKFHDWIGDTHFNVSKLYGMLPASASGDWNQGEDVIMTGTVSNDEAKEIYGTWQEPKPYIRIVAQPS